MNAIEFVENFGVSEAKKVVDYRDKYAKECHTYLFTKGGGSYSTSHSYTSDGLNVNVDDIKQIVEAFEIIGLFKNLDHAKLELTACETAMHSQILVKLNVGVGYIGTCRVKQAIELVEKCNASD